MTPRRIPVFIVIALTITVLAIADHSHHEPARADAVATRGLMPVASPPASVSSSFFCAGGGADASGSFDSTVVIANPNPAPINTTLTVYPAALASDAAGTAAVAPLQPLVKAVPVGARSRTEVHLADVQAAPFVAALVDTNDPDITVEHRVKGKSGFSSSPCASSPSPSWFIPTGTTTRDARELLAVFNPFSADAVVDITFQTNDGFRSPEGLQGLPVMAGHLRMVDVAAEVPRLEQLSAFVHARAGQVVVDRLQAFDGTDPNHPAGTAATLGAPQPAPVWMFAGGEVTDGLRETITVMNPGDAPATAQLEVVLSDPATNGVVDPIPITVAPRGYVQVAMQDQTRIPKTVPHSVTVRASAGANVVAERVFSAVAPASPGFAPALGAPLQATRWFFADGAVAGTSAHSLVLFNPSVDATARVSVAVLAGGQLTPIDRLQQVELPAAGRLQVDVAPLVNRPDASLVIDSTAPVVAEQSMATATAIAWSTGMPAAETTTVPAEVVATTTTTSTLPASAAS